MSKEQEKSELNEEFQKILDEAIIVDDYVSDSDDEETYQKNIISFLCPCFLDWDPIQ